jgi:hypothetical protein
MASISPVMTKVSGLPFFTLYLTVVSSVLGKQFSNIQRNFSSFILGFASSMAASTAFEMKFLLLAEGRNETYLWLKVPDEDNTEAG